MGARKSYGTVKLDINGRVRIPVELRDEQGWTRGKKFKVEFDEETKEVILIPLKETKTKIVTESGVEIEIDE